MKLRSYQAFCAAVDTGSISAAARELYLSQPTVTERIGVLEQSAGVELLERSKRGVVATPQGKTLYDKARRMLSEVEALESTLESALLDLREANTMRLRFAAGVVCGEYLLPEWLWRFERDTPGVTPEIFMGSDPEVVCKVESGEIPLGVVANEGCSHAFDVIPIFNEELVIIVHPDHPWTKHNKVTLKTLSDELFISKEPGSSISAFTEYALEDLGLPPLKPHMQLRSLTAIKQAVESGLGFSILPKASVYRKLEAGRLAEVQGLSIPWEYKLIHNRSVRLSDAEARFHEFLTQRRAGD